MSSKIIVFTAKNIHTMCEAALCASAVAVRDGIIVEAGTLESLKPWLDSVPYEIDDRYASKTIMPGFIDPHCISSLEQSCCR